MASLTHEGTSQRCRRTEPVLKNREATLFFKKDGVVMILVSGSERINLSEK